ncbi:MAG: signal peptidase I [Bacteroidia bacterium]|nr:signal peptidase I [Bacteroidia bacterium]NNC85306.1 signal peptidase I [Bacteroidia bacterium]NNM15933.1 signal peptidase I [Bacteroidia bacterium]
MNWKFWKTTKKKSVAREWIDALVFAIIAATIIRAFLIEAFTIPTPSMENSLMVGDFLFVSKVSYGPRAPMTPIAIPLVHQKILGFKSYSEIVQWDYKRLWGFGEVERNDAVVFNYPMDKMPIDKRTHYIKRCVGLPGETLKIVDRQLYIDDKAIENPPGLQMTHTVTTDGTPLNPLSVEKLGIREGGAIASNMYNFTCTEEQANKLEAFVNVTSVEPNTPSRNAQTYPYSPELDWTKDNYGPIYIPKKGVSIPLDSKNYYLYNRVITAYEGKSIQNQDGIYLIDGKPATEYTFEMDYYWMMGDNRDNSSDSRFWGFVPENHVVGKAVFIWLSIDKHASFFNKIRWSRLFNRVRPM